MHPQFHHLILTTSFTICKTEIGECGKKQTLFIVCDLMTSSNLFIDRHGGEQKSDSAAERPESHLAFGGAAIYPKASLKPTDC